MLQRLGVVYLLGTRAWLSRFLYSYSPVSVVEYLVHLCRVCVIYVPLSECCNPGLEVSLLSRASSFSVPTHSTDWPAGAVTPALLPAHVDTGGRWAKDDERIGPRHGIADSHGCRVDPRRCGNIQAGEQHRRHGQGH